MPPGKRALNSKWVLRIKRGKNGEVERYKARLVIKGCAQRQCYDYNETYAPVCRLTTVRTLLPIINENNLFATQLDVKNASLHGNLREEVYMKQPPGFETEHDLVYKLNKTLYGLKQSPREWTLHLTVLLSL